MDICIVGWYGTETIGDRAIIAGIYSFLSKSFDNINIKLGSLYPFYSERMLKEDKELYDLILDKEINISMFDSRQKKELDNAIQNSDFVIMGGGPIMHIDELYMVEYAIKKAKNKGKMTGIIGCGIGPLFPESFKKSTINIIDNSDIVILRDRKSKENLLDIYKEFNKKLEVDRIKVSFDPAVECALRYVKAYKEKVDRNEIIINLREFPGEYSKEAGERNINDILEKFIVDIAKKYPEELIRLVPMHYFHIGSDDRVFLNSIKIKNNIENIVIQNEILSLTETMDMFITAKFNVGMRFHSVVLQTILSGKNYILDYTEPNKGKISGFISDIDDKQFYKDRFVSLQEVNSISTDMLDEEDNNTRFEYEIEKIKRELDVYIDELYKIKEAMDGK